MNHLNNKEFREYVRMRDDITINCLTWNIRILRSLKIDYFSDPQTKEEQDWSRIVDLAIGQNIIMLQNLLIETHEVPSQIKDPDLKKLIPRDNVLQIEALENLYNLQAPETPKATKRRRKRSNNDNKK